MAKTETKLGEPTLAFYQDMMEHAQKMYDLSEKYIVKHGNTLGAESISIISELEDERDTLMWEIHQLEVRA